jgi:hypothetical protein
MCSAGLSLAAWHWYPCGSLCCLRVCLAGEVSKSKCEEMSDARTRSRVQAACCSCRCGLGDGLGSGEGGGGLGRLPQSTQ